MENNWLRGKMLEQVMTGEWDAIDEISLRRHLRERLKKLCGEGECATISNSDFESLVKLCIKDEVEAADFNQRLDVTLIMMCLHRTLCRGIQSAVMWAVKQTKECDVNFDVLTGRDNYHSCNVLVLKHGDEIKRFEFGG